jgi:hypothetical protein
MTETDLSTTQELLNTPLTTDQTDSATIGQYLVALLTRLWVHDNEFNPVDPFGKGRTWKVPVIIAMIRAGHLTGEVYESGRYAKSYDKVQFASLMTDIFTLLFEADYSTLAPKPEPKNWHVVYLGLSQNSEPVLEDYYLASMTEEEAKSTAEELKQENPQTNWFAVQIPS